MNATDLNMSDPKKKMSDPKKKKKPDPKKKLEMYVLNNFVFM